MDLARIAGDVTDVDEKAVEDELTAWVENAPLPDREPWKITSVGAADWAMRRLADCKARVQEYEDEVFLWQRAMKRLRGAGDWFETRLKEWAVEQRTAQRKTFPLAHGAIQTREHQRKPVVVNEAEAIGWAKSHRPGAVNTVESFLISKAEVAVADLVVAWRTTNKESGETERVEVRPQPFDADHHAKLQERLGDGFVIEPEMAAFVVDEHGVPVPGLDVEPSRVTASVKPLGL